MTEATRETVELHYLTSVPDAVPLGEVLAHNNVQPAARLGMRGFRAWTQAPTSSLEHCDCGWTGIDHYRVSDRAWS